MISSADLFVLTLLSTGGLYLSMLAYFNGLVGSKHRNTQIMWNSEPVLWILTFFLAVAVIFQIIGPMVGAQAPGVWYLTGAGNLLIVYIYLIMELARHDLPVAGYWSVFALTVLAILNTVVSLAPPLISQSLDLGGYREILGILLVSMTLILVLLVLFNLVRSLQSSLLKTWTAEPNSRDRHTAGGVAVTATGEVSNPDGVLSDINLQAGETSESNPATLNKDSCIVVDFGVRRIEDHGFRSDLRIIGDNADQVIAVEVSNDKQNWVVCDREEEILTDWDVPYFGSPWRYVRIRNQGDQAIQIAEVYDLD